MSEVKVASYFLKSGGHNKTYPLKRGVQNAYALIGICKKYAVSWIYYKNGSSYYIHPGKLVACHLIPGIDVQKSMSNLNTPIVGSGSLQSKKTLITFAFYKIFTQDLHHSNQLKNPHLVIYISIELQLRNICNRKLPYLLMVVL